jgi:hypothetical protein
VVLNKLFLTVFFVLPISITGSAQDKQKPSLQKILKVLEDRYDVTFTYVDENIAGIFITPPSKKLALNEAMDYLERHTGLLFRQLNERYITISKVQGASGDICGIISDSDTGERIPEATIQSGDEFAMSDGKGYFYLKDVPENTIVHVSFVGYKPLDIPAKELLGRPCKSLSLHPQFTTLPEIFVADFITEGIDKTVDGSFIIGSETLGVLPGVTEPDVLQTIQTLPGIQSVNETISDINVRGGTNDQTLILWDGIRIYHSGHFFGLISAYNPYLTDKTTLTKNGSSAALGDGVSGTIDIHTDDHLSEHFSGGAGINMINADVLAKISLSEKASLHVSTRRSIADLLHTPAYKQYFKRAFRDTDVTTWQNTDTLVARGEKFYFYDTSLKLLYNITQRDKLRLSFLNVFNDIEYQENAAINNSLQSKTSELEQHNVGSGISYSRLWNEKIRTSAQLYLSSYKLAAVNFDVPADQRLIQENEVTDEGIKIDARVNVAKNIDLFSGYQFFEVGVTNLENINNPPFQRSVKKVVRTHAAFLEGNFSFQRTNLRMGVRGSYFPRFEKTVVEPRLSFNQNIFKDLFLEILGEMKNQTITQIIDLQTDFLGVEKRRWVLSNDNDIPIIRSKQLSAGIYYKKGNLLISAETYYKLVRGIITSSQAFQNQFQFIRSKGNYETIGIDFLTSKKIDRFTAWFSYSNARSTFEFPLLIPTSFPNNLDIRHRTTFGCSYQTGNVELSSGVNWHTGKPFTAPAEMNEIVNNTINYDAPNTSRLDDYLRIDLSVRYRFTISDRVKGQLAGSLWNIINRKNVVNAYFYIGDNDELKHVEQHSLSITPNLLVRLSF